jgi:hypothetical protein
VKTLLLAALALTMTACETLDFGVGTMEPEKAICRDKVTTIHEDGSITVNYKERKCNGAGHVWDSRIPLPNFPEW